MTDVTDGAARCRERFGYGAAFDYRRNDPDTALRDHAPRGIDVFFDNTGGVILDTAPRHMAQGGRIVQCGTAAIPAWAPAPTGLRNEREILTRRPTWSGLVIFDHPRLYQTAADRLAAPGTTAARC